MQNTTTFQSMYLSTLPNQKKIYKNVDRSLITDDISGARSKHIEKPRIIRDTFINHNQDIEKSKPKRLIPADVYRPNFQFQITDINGQVKNKKNFHSNRHTNPLDPQYRIPQVYIPQPPEPKFIRDNMAIDDIDGVRTKETFVSKLMRAGKTIQKQQITTKNKSKLAIKTQNFMLDVTDINFSTQFKQPNRHTNPLQPKYKVYTEQGWGIIGQIEKNKPYSVNKPIKENFNLKTHDIKGASPKKHWTIVHQSKPDIVQARPGTAKKGIQTNRVTNPLAPSYQYPGNSEYSSVGYQRPKTAAQRLDKFIK